MTILHPRDIGDQVDSIAADYLPLELSDEDPDTWDATFKEDIDDRLDLSQLGSALQMLDSLREVARDRRISLPGLPFRRTQDWSLILGKRPEMSSLNQDNVVRRPWSPI